MSNSLSDVYTTVRAKYKQAPVLHSYLVILTLLFVYLLFTSSISWELPFSKSYIPPTDSGMADVEIMTNRKRTTARVEAFTPQYQKELDLFKSMTMQEQENYLNMSKVEKLAMYAPQLQ